MNNLLMLELQLDDTDDAWEENVGRFNIDIWFI